MSANPDFSQFRRKNISTPLSAEDYQQQVQPQASQLDLSQFKRKEERSALQKTGRLAAQGAIGLAEGALIPYELGVAPLASKEAQQVGYRENVFEDIARLQAQKQSIGLDKTDEDLLANLKNQIKEPAKAEKFVKTADIGVRGLAESATGVDLKPEGILEKAIHWTGFIKSPKGIKELLKVGTNPTQIMKAILPGKDSLRGLTAGTALELAEEGKFGPLGTMGSVLVGDLIGGSLPSIGKAIANPTKTLAKGAALLANNKKAIAQDLAEASKGKPLLKDIGTLTNNNIIQMVQSRLAASGLTGKPLENLRKEMTREIVEEYESIAGQLGEAKYDTLFEAGEISKEALTEIRNAEKSRISEIYSQARSKLNDQSTVNPTKLASNIQRLEEALKPGAVKSTEQKAVLDIVENLKKDIYDGNGQLRPAQVQNLLNNKAALNDIINYEVQGGQKQLLKGLVSDLDRLILSYGARDKEFLKLYSKANADFRKHAQDFRNRNLDAILKSDNPQTLINRMNSVQGIRDLKKSFDYSPEGRRVFNDLARKKLDMMFNINSKEGLQDQLKFGKFSNVLSKGKNREIAKEILSPDSYKRLVNLEKHVGELAESANKFFNASSSATAAADLTAVGSIFMGVAGAITGNPWMLSAAGAVGGSRLLSGLIANPEFLRLTEEAINAAKKNDIGLMQRIAKDILNVAKEVSPQAAQVSLNQGLGNAN